MSRAKIIGVAVVTVLVLIILLQNTDTVETKLLFATIKMPRALLLFITLLVGFLVGLVTAGRMTRKPAPKEADRPSG